MLHMFCEIYRQKAHHVDGARGRRHRMRLRKPNTKQPSKDLLPMDTEDVLRTLRHRHVDLLALYKARPTERNRANVLGAKQTYQEYKTWRATATA